MTTYPKDFPLAESIELVQLVRQQKVKEELPKFAKNVWVLQGYAMKATIGEPGAETPNVALPFAVKPSEFDAIAELEKLNANVDDVTTQAIIPWTLVLKWILDELIAIVVDEISKNG